MMVNPFNKLRVDAERSRSINDSKLSWFYFVGFFLILALPLLYLPPWFSPPDWGKTIVFRIILATMVFLFVWQILYKPKESEELFSRAERGGRRNEVSSPSRATAKEEDLSSSTSRAERGGRRNEVSSPSAGFSGGTKIIIFLLLLLLGIFFLATLFSLDFSFSLLGSPYRAGGFLNFAFYIIFTILAFLILKRKGWQTVWDIALIVGILVAIVAIFQQFGFFSKTLIPFEIRPPSTLGNPVFLAVYLLLFCFIALSFGIKERKLSKKIFYFISFFLFVFIIFLSYTRAAYFGLLVGFFYFLFFYPAPAKIRYGAGPKKIIWLKIILLVILIFGVFGFYFINTASELPQFTQKNKFLLWAIQRVSIKNILQDPRISGWQVSWQALKSRPILGYGPENFHIAFNKFYDASLPGIAISSNSNMATSWWDRGHNFIFDISITAGIPALVIYLFLFIVLFRQLQKIKERGQNTIIIHGVQTTFLAYLAVNFFTFDTFSSYLIFFLLIAYSLYLISFAQNFPEKTQKDYDPPKDGASRYAGTLSWPTTLLPFPPTRNRKKITKAEAKLQGYKTPILSFIFLFLILFIWFFNLRPLLINAEINSAELLFEKNECKKAIVKMEKILPKKSFLDSYLRLKYVKILSACAEKMPQFSLEFSKKGYLLLKENIEIQPYFTRNWLWLINFTNMLIEREKNPEIVEELKKEANYYFEKAFQLSPNRQELFIEGIKTDLLTREYQKAKAKSKICIDLNPKTGSCYFFAALTNIYLNENEEALTNINFAKEKGYPIDSENSLLSLAKVYVDTKNYQNAIDIYLELIKIKPKEIIYHTYLALIYREINDFENATKMALILLELTPENKEEIEEFLETLK